MKVDLDARTLEAMRVLVEGEDTLYVNDYQLARKHVRDFIRAHDSARDAERDEALAVAMINSVLEMPQAHVKTLDLLDDSAKQSWLKRARAARDFIAKEQGQ